MIKSKTDLIYYLKLDKVAMSRTGRVRIGDRLWRFEIILRKYEYYYNCSHNALAKLYYHLLFKKMSERLGFTIPINVIGPGLCLPHYGNIIISNNSRIGANCKIHVGVNIGASSGQPEAPCIGDNVYIGPGAKIFGGIQIPDDCVIGANAVVNKSLEVPGRTYGGIPAKCISDNDSKVHLVRQQI